MVYAIFFLLMRWIHVGSATLIIGGLALIVLSSGPIKALTLNDELDQTIKRIESRYRWVLLAAVIGLVISGVYQWVIFGQLYQENGPLILIVLSVKVLIATTFFALVWAFQVDSMVSAEARTWRIVNLMLVVLVLMLAGVVRYLRIEAMEVVSH